MKPRSLPFAWAPRRIFQSVPVLSAGTTLPIACSKQPNTRSGKNMPMVERATTGLGKEAFAMQSSGAVTVMHPSVAALFGRPGATRHFTPKAA
ncbi:hypothetical protein D3C72_2116360 [compost metagenome]